MKKTQLMYLEHFISLQGEGKFTGVPSVFLRTFGCNFTCQGFGQPKDRSLWVSEKDMPHNLFDASKIKSINDLPIFPIGCDSSASWSARYKHMAKKGTPLEIAKSLSKLVNSKWYRPYGCDTHLVITGGEPLLPRWQKAYSELLFNKYLKDLLNLTFETNGTQPLTKELLDDCFWSTSRHFNLTWSVSPKLSISGESWKDAIKPKVVKSYAEIYNTFLYLKFVVREESDFEEIDEAVNEYKKAGVKIGAVYAMPVGGTEDTLTLNETKVADLCVKRNIRFSTRLHTHLWGNKWGT